MSPDASKSMQTRAPFDISRCYPYIVPRSYLQSATADDEGLVREFGHGLFIVLVQDHDGLVGSVTLEDLQRANLTPELAHNRALENLHKLFVSGKVVAKRYDNGPAGHPVIVIGYHWAAAACLILPDVQSFARKNLGQDRVLASIPHRDVLLLFQEGDAESHSQIHRFVGDRESDGRKPLTSGLFRLGDGAVIPVQGER